MSMRHDEDTLYLPIKQTYFDQIIAGTKKEEFREVKYGVTSSRYLQKDEHGQLVLNPEVTEQGKKYYVDDYNDGRFPFLNCHNSFTNLCVFCRMNVL